MNKDKKNNKFLFVLILIIILLLFVFYFLIFKWQIFNTFKQDYFDSSKTNIKQNVDANINSNHKNVANNQDICNLNYKGNKKLSGSNIYYCDGQNWVIFNENNFLKPPIPDIPENKDKSIIWKWQEVLNADYYEWSVDGINWVNIGKANSFVENELKPLTNYVRYVRACNNKGCSEEVKLISNTINTIKNPCEGKSIGQACEGTTALYAGFFNNYNYMTTPGGCKSDEINEVSNFTPICNGEDDVLKRTWNDGTTNWYDFSDLKNYDRNSIPTHINDGDKDGLNNTNIINSYSSQIHKAARYCANMVYGGYDDWYLPSAAELFHVLYLNKDLIKGFDKKVYWSSTEFDNEEAWFVYFYAGSSNSNSKNVENYIRCIRRY